jgi:peptide/nickel transport system substrate-binding protein
MILQSGNATPAKTGIHASAPSMPRKWPPAVAGMGLALLLAAPTLADEAPKHGGTLTYMIPSDAPPSLDGHHEGTFATLQATAPFYSVLIRINPENPSSTADFVCDLCTEMPQPTDRGKTYTIKLRDGVKFTDGAPLTSADVTASWEHIVFPPEGYLSPRKSWFTMVDKIEAPDPHTIVFHLKFATSAFLPALGDPFAFVYQKAKIDKDPHWYEKNILGSGPFKLVAYETGQSITGERNPDYYRQGQPYLDGFTAIFAAKQATRVEAIRADRAAIEFRGLPPSARDELKGALGDQLTVQESDWNCGSVVWINQQKKPFDDARVRRALSLAIDRWHGAEALAKIANVRTVGGIVFPGSPLAANKDELASIAGYWPDIEKSRAEARRLLKEAGAENLSFELTTRGVDQPYKTVGIWLVDEWSKIGLHVTQKVEPTGVFIENYRTGNYTVESGANCHEVVNPIMDVQPYLPNSYYSDNHEFFEDPQQVALYDEMLRETDPAKQRVLMRQFERRVLDEEVHALYGLWWYRIIPYRSYVKGWKISPSHYINQDLATIWLDK